MESDDIPTRVRIRDLVLYYLRLGALGFGGPVALVGQMEKELVQERKWLTKAEMREGIAVCQSLPGPLAIQVGIFIAYLRGGVWGAWAGGWASSCRTSSSWPCSAPSTCTSAGFHG